MQLPKSEENDKWRLLRQQFRNALAKMAKFKSGMAAKKKTRPPNEFFSAMQFMKPIVELASHHRESNLPSTVLSSTASSTDLDTVDEAFEVYYASDIENSTPSPPPIPGPSVPKRARRNNSDDMYRAAVTKAMDIVNAGDESSEHIWARYVGSVMTGYPNPDAVRRFKFIVNRLVEQLEMGDFDAPLESVQNLLICEDPLIHNREVHSEQIQIHSEDSSLLHNVKIDDSSSSSSL